MPVFTQGNGVRLYTTTGEEWLDFRSGIMTATLGHGNETVLGAIWDAAHPRMLLNTYQNYGEPYYNAMNALYEFAPHYNWHVLNTGAEAMDRALQLACMYFKRPVRIAALKGGFHGKTIPFAYMRHPDAPWGNPFNIELIDPEADTPPRYPFDVLLYEPVVSLTGQRVDEVKLKSWCEPHGALMVADEMVTGFWRCGERLMSRHADIVIAGKGLGQGLPVSVIGTHLETRTIPVGWSTTASGNNIVMSVANAVLREFIKNEEHYVLAATIAEQRLQQIGFTAYGALGFYRPPCGWQKANETLTRHRILATIREDGLMRVGPPLLTQSHEYDLLSEAIEEMV